MRSFFRFLLRSIALWALAATTVSAQGFNTMSGRNHPEIDWQVAETAHFRIMYPAHLAGIEAEAAAVAEATYETLAANLNVGFDRPIRIYLSDEDEILNGFAVDIGNGYTNLWVHVNEAAEVWTGREKWLRKVIAHELTHLFHYRAVRSNLGFVGRLIANPMPRFWAEGLAQYQTETWDAQRGDRWLRTAVLDDALSYADNRSVWNGRLLYASGNAQVRYFADRYGDSTLARLLAHRRPALFGLGRVHDFGAAFRHVTGRPYSRFFDDWRRHVNVYYNTLAGQMEAPDSLGVEPLGVPGQYVYDVAYSPDTTRVAVVALTSLERPVRRLYVVRRASRQVNIAAEGAIDGPISWSPDGRRIAFTRSTRGANGSLLNDLFVVYADGRGERRLTRSRRASSPSFDPTGSRVAFVGSERGTANLYVLNLTTGAETVVTRYTGDVQISSVRWHPSADRLVMARFDASGRREIVLVDLAAGAERVITSGDHDDRAPVWSPDGERIAFTSLRDGVPNVFVLGLADGREARVTHLATGATAHAWLPPDSVRAEGSLVVVSSVEKTRDRAYRIDAARRAVAAPPVVPAEYAAWTMHRPPREVPTAIAPDPSLVTARHPYRAWRNLTHAATLALPYYDDPKDWGVIGLTAWVEPLGRHLISALGGVSFASPARNSFVAGSYVYNGWRPTVALSLYRLPGSIRFYGNDLLVENYTGGDVSLVWPLDVWVRPYTSTSLGLRLRYAGIDPLNEDAVDAADYGLAPPESGRQADVRLSLARTRQRPYRHAVVHPLDGIGARLQLTAAAAVAGARSRFLRADVAAYHILPALGTQRLFVYGRAQAQTGHAFVQDYLGFSRYDEIQIGIPGYVPITLGDVERVRGHRAYALGDRVLFGSAEYRMLLLPDLQTQLLGLVSLGGTALAGFIDAGMVWTGADVDAADRRTGAGLELKNALRLGVVEFGHAVGVAWPVGRNVQADDEPEVYYRVRASLPF